MLLRTFTTFSRIHALRFLLLPILASCQFFLIFSAIDIISLLTVRF